MTKKGDPTLVQTLKVDANSINMLLYTSSNDEFCTLLLNMDECRELELALQTAASLHRDLYPDAPEPWLGEDT